MKYIYFSFAVLLISFLSFKSSLKVIQPSTDKTITKIAFGSCSYQKKPQPILNNIVDKNPDMFIYLGDNIYADTRDTNVLIEDYTTLASKPEFQNLVKNIPILATWDDHDFGENDAGREYPIKKESREIFLNFWNEPKDSDRRKNEGIYHSQIYGKGDKTLQVILLDTRYFRDKLIENTKIEGYKNDYIPNSSPDSTFLGNEQWIWLENEFKKEATIRIIASSNQFSHEYNGYESWTNVPHERQKMINLISLTRANGVIFISGDVHWAEISKISPKEQYPIYDITSSGITQTWHKLEPNKYRVGEACRDNNFGVIDINWEKEELHFSIFDKKDEERISHDVKFKEISFKE